MKDAKWIKKIWNNIQSKFWRDKKEWIIEENEERKKERRKIMKVKWNEKIKWESGSKQKLSNEFLFEKKKKRKMKRKMS